MIYADKILLLMVLMIERPLAVSACGKECRDCNSQNNCTKCASELYLYQGACYSCPCLSCNGIKCTSCYPGWYGDRCHFQCPQNCETCNINNGLCTICKWGYYGLGCKDKCTQCIEKSCETHPCSLRCKPGSYARKKTHSDSTYCSNCTQNCKYCQDFNTCNVCNEGYFSKKNLYGNVFCTACPNNCKICMAVGNSIVCKECNRGYTNREGNCVPNTETCSSGCLAGCDSFGLCLNMCPDGFAGDNCTASCKLQCLKCNRNDRSVCQSCRGDNYTKACTKKCPPSCKRVKGASTCRIEDGFCLNECGKNLWGHFCNESCSDGCASDGDKSNTCDRHNGKCKNRCRNGFSGDKCIRVAPVISGSVKSVTIPQMKTTISSDGKREASSQDDSLNVVFIGSIAGGAMVFLFVSSMFIVCFVKGRKPHYANNENTPGEADNADAEANVYSQPVKSRNEECLYAQVKKANKRNNERENEQQTVKRVTCIDFNVEEILVDLEQDADIEEIEEENTNHLESDLNIPTSDTYYNTSSLIRSRIEVSSLYEYIKNKTDYKKEFERLPVDLTRTCSEAIKPNNRVKNRYNGIYAYDATRVVLKSGNYVNANFIDGYKKCPAYIASLGPTRSTMKKFATFWEIVWQENTDKIVMLTKLDEAKKMKCEQYWPGQKSENDYGDYKVKCAAEKLCSEFIVRDLIVTKGNDTREVTQYQYTAWPDKSVPDSVASLLEFRDKVEQKQSNTAGPMMVHCSAGIGRTGTYIALDILIKEGKDDKSVDIFGCVNALRGQRVQMVQNLEQYVYLHYCVLYVLSCAPEPLLVSTNTRFSTDERLYTQHKAFVSLQQIANSDKIMRAKNKTRTENRIAADITDDKHRVRLALIEKDYINAIYVNGYQERNKFILAQTPLQGSLEDFVSILYQERCPCVVCLDDENVMDKSIAQYIPSVNKVATFGQFQLICTDIGRKQDFISRKLKVSRIGVSLSDEVSVSHYQFKGWSSIDCVPRSIKSFLNLVTDVEKTYQSLNSYHPIVVHCSTGAERSGLFCAVSILLEKVALEKEVSVLNTVCQVCSRRRSAFQDIEHLRFCYSCVEQMSEVSDSSTYYNSRNM